jgi:hypothetical protein
MLFRSTGLGKRELVAEIIGIHRQGDYLIMEVQTTEPVSWKIRGGLSWKDLRTLVKETMKVSVLFFFMKPASWFRKPQHPGEF